MGEYIWVLVVKEANKHNIRYVEILKCSINKICAKMIGLGIDGSAANKLSSNISESSVIIIDREKYRATLCSSGKENKSIKDEDICYSMIDAVYENYELRSCVTHSDDVVRAISEIDNLDKKNLRAIKKKSKGVKGDYVTVLTREVSESGEISIDVMWCTSSVREAFREAGGLSCEQLLDVEKGIKIVMFQKINDNDTLMLLISKKEVYIAVNINTKMYHKIEYMLKYSMTGLPTDY